MTMQSVCMMLVFLFLGINTHPIDPTSIYESVCITGSSEPTVNGRYSYVWWNSTINGPVYHNNATGRYLHPYISSSGVYQWLSQRTPGSDTSSSYCTIHRTDNLYFDPNDCFEGWKSYNYSNKSWKAEPNQRVVSCNDICITGNDYEWLDGTYIWSGFNLTLNSSIYYCLECDYSPSDKYSGAYLHGWTRPDKTEYKWLIGPDDVSGLYWSKCLYSTSISDPLPIRNLDHCISWYTWDGSADSLDLGMTVKKCPTNQVSNIVIKTQSDFGSKSVGFYLENKDISCSVTITSIEITDNKNYKNIWIPCNLTEYTLSDRCTFKHEIKPFTVPITVRITKNTIPDIITGKDVIASFDGNKRYDFGSNVCGEPTPIPTLHPTTTIPTKFPSRFPTPQPTKTPTKEPIYDPTSIPTKAPTYDPSITPTPAPTAIPTNIPSHHPSNNPTSAPTIKPTNDPIKNPTNLPTQTPTKTPTNHPSAVPTPAPTALNAPLKYPAILFGIETSSYSQSLDVQTSHRATLTLYWLGSVYQCNIEPSEFSTYYGCDTGDNITTTKCDSDKMTLLTPNGLQMDINDGGLVEIERVIIQVFRAKNDSNTFITERFCFNHSGDYSSNMANGHCLGATNSGYHTITMNYGSFLYQSGLFIINTNDISQDSYVDIIGYHERQSLHECIPENVCIDAIVSPIYGSSNIGVKNANINQGKITAITSWGIDSDSESTPGIAHFRWKSDKQTILNNEYGWGKHIIIDKCLPYTLGIDDYINQYRVVYDNTTIYGIYFRTKNGKLLQCTSNSVPPDAMDSDDILYKNRYLSGFYVVSTEIIKSISFQFTALNNTNKCVQDTVVETNNILIATVEHIQNTQILEATPKPTNKPTTYLNLLQFNQSEDPLLMIDTGTIEDTEGYELVIILGIVGLMVINVAACVCDHCKHRY